MDQKRKLLKLSTVSEVFTPGSPVHTADLFAGRTDQLLRLFGVLGQKGQHAALYGERGVGKTSLAKVVGEIFSLKRNRQVSPIFVTCSTNDTYRSLWRSIFRRLGIDIDEHDINMDRVLEEIEKIDGSTLIIIDELDRFSDDDGLSLLADTIKALSDHRCSITIILVGVADSIEALIGEHKSIERSIIQVNMPRMSMSELSEIVDRGLRKLNMSISLELKQKIARHSEGLPSFTHLLCSFAATHAIQDDRTEIIASDLEKSIKDAVEKAQHTTASDYHNAIRSVKGDNLFREVLLACALAEKDELGYFPSRNVREPLQQILGRPVRISGYVRHLSKFTEAERNFILQVQEKPNRKFYRFTTPTLQPFIILKGLAEGLLKEDVLSALRPIKEDKGKFSFMN